MKQSRAMILAMASLGILALGWRVGAAPADSLVLAGTTANGTTPTPGASPTPSTTTPSTTTPVGQNSTTAPPIPAPPAPPAGPTGTYAGPAVSTAYGTMQVQIVVSNGKITAVQPLVIGYGDGTSRQINAQAVPTLEQRVVSAQSANVSYVSGASYTSQGYLASVQGAMSSAGI